MAISNDNEKENRTLDVSVLEKINEYGESNGEPQMAADLLRIFFDTTPSRLVKLEEAVRTHDAKSTHLLAHSLKSSCAYMGAWRMRGLCNELEKRCLENVTAEADELFRQIKTEYVNVMTELNRLSMSWNLN